MSAPRPEPTEPDATPSPPEAISWELPPELEYFKTSEAYRVELPDFYGPLDLLLFLIQKDELDIYDIPIARITEQFLAYAEVIQTLSLDNAGDFIVMAATLMRIKARLLLPTPPPDEEFDEEDPRAELVRRLLEYKRFKDMAAEFRQKEEERARLHVRHQRYPFLAESAEAPPLRLNLFELLQALSKVFDRISKEAVHNVVRELFTVEQKTAYILARLAAEQTIRFDECFADDAIKMEVVVTFVAILELSKSRRISIVQTEVNGPIWVRPGEAADEPDDETTNPTESELEA